MAYKNLQEFINVLEKEGELIRIKTYVNPHLEIAEITDRISKSKNGGKALLFENTGYEFSCSHECLWKRKKNVPCSWSTRSQ